MTETPKTKRLRDLRNVGPAALKDFALLGIDSVAHLAASEPDSLYLRLEQLTGVRQAQRSNSDSALYGNGLPRRCAPRNDDSRFKQPAQDANFWHFERCIR